jgi:peptide deformylase
MIKQLQILKHPHSILSTVCTKVEVVNDALRELSHNMTFTMLQAGGIGLAANQVGVVDRVVVMLIGGAAVTLINPEITKQSSLQNAIQEGCLSIPHRSRTRPRYGSVTVSYKDLTGKDKQVNLGGLESVCIQHEIDHLNGKTMLD